MKKGRERPQCLQNWQRLRAINGEELRATVLLFGSGAPLSQHFPRKFLQARFYSTPIRLVARPPVLVNSKLQFAAADCSRRAFGSALAQGRAEAGDVNGRRCLRGICW